MIRRVAVGRRRRVRHGRVRSVGMWRKMAGRWVHVASVWRWPLVHCMLPSNHFWVWLTWIRRRESIWGHVRMLGISRVAHLITSSRGHRLHPPQSLLHHLVVVWMEVRGHHSRVHVSRGPRSTHHRSHSYSWFCQIGEFVLQALTQLELRAFGLLWLLSFSVRLITEL